MNTKLLKDRDGKVFVRIAENKYVDAKVKKKRPYTEWDVHDMRSLIDFGFKPASEEDLTTYLS